MKNLIILFVLTIISACSSGRYIETKFVDDRRTEVFFTKDFSEAEGNVFRFYGKGENRFETEEGAIFMTAPAGEEIICQVKDKDQNLIIDLSPTMDQEKWTYVRLVDFRLEPGKYTVEVEFLTSEKKYVKYFIVENKTSLYRTYYDKEQDQDPSKVQKEKAVNTEKSNQSTSSSYYYHIYLDCPEYHCVKNGETFFRISMIYNLKMSYILFLNPQICNPDKIYPGQKIRLR